jgi:hypothetical protein
LWNSNVEFKREFKRDIARLLTTATETAPILDTAGAIGASMRQRFDSSHAMFHLATVFRREWYRTEKANSATPETSMVQSVGFSGDPYLNFSG